VLDEVAAIVGHVSDPYRRPHESVDTTVPLAARIIRVVNAFDDLVAGSHESGRRFEALERLRLGMAYDYDPKVVETLSRIVERSTHFGL
jgi:response regulator RpfG family c-di-GMP phosphodiesterase